jgi:type II secretory pathway predicted ATPase ExeA
MINYKNYYGFTKEPFSQDIKVEDLYIFPALLSAEERFNFAIDVRAVCIVTGEVGTGKSTLLRYCISKLHPSLYKVIPVIANTGSMLEILKQICIALGIDFSSRSISVLLKNIRDEILDISRQRRIPVLAVDESQLIRLDVFSQLHTLFQFEMDSKPIIPIIFAGQNSLIDNLIYAKSKPLASRVVGRSHLEGLKLKEIRTYLKHHLEIAGINEQLFSDEAINAIHQSSGGFLRRINLLSKGSLIASAKEECRVVSAEHVRVASTEII